MLRRIKDVLKKHRQHRTKKSLESEVRSLKAELQRAEQSLESKEEALFAKDHVVRELESKVSILKMEVELLAAVCERNYSRVIEEAKRDSHKNEP